MIAILGATGYVGNSLARRYAETDARPLVLFARSPQRLRDQTWPDRVRVEDLRGLDAAEFSLVINAIGAGDPSRVAAAGDAIVELTQYWDSALLAAMNPLTRYVFLSSGAVYGGAGAVADAQLVVSINADRPLPPYLAAKLLAELRHRNLPERAILDLRIFGYADPSISLDDRFFLAELARSIVRSEPFVTSPDDMVRDYAAALELKALIDCWEAADAPNGPADLYTSAPVRKLELLDAARGRYGLQVVTSASSFANPTGAKPYYASTWRRAGEFGYTPQRSSLQIVLDMLDRLGGARLRATAESQLA